MATVFGTTLHVSGRDRAALEEAIAPLSQAPIVWTETRPTLEDVFIQLMNAPAIATPPPTTTAGALS